MLLYLAGKKIPKKKYLSNAMKERKCNALLAPAGKQTQ
jgi:hypothetical protein